MDDLFDQDFKADYLAMGAHKGMDLGIPGEEAVGVVQGVRILKDTNLGQPPEMGQKVAIIGGGNVAMDVCRTIRRLGVDDVTVVYRRTRDEMPAWEEEIEAAVEEGVNFTYLAAPQQILVEDGKVKGLRCIRMELGEPDASGRRRPVPIPGSEFDLDVDMIVPAVGQVPALEAISEEEGIEINRFGTIEADPVSYETSRPGVFAGGDMQTGPWVAIGAVAAGNEAAVSIERYFQGEDLKAGREPIDQDMAQDWRDIPEDEERKPRLAMPTLPVEERLKGFEEVALGFDPELGMAEASKCISCGICCECYCCVDACKADALTRETLGWPDQTREIKVGSVILTTGAQTFDPSIFNTHHYSDHPNVITALEFERILASGGPTVGQMVRPGDGQEPRKIAFLQCVGSRDINLADHGYCSSVCCMYAIKESIVSKEHSQGEVDVAVFYMDIRTFGKNFELYYERAKSEGVRFIRSRVHTIDPLRNSGNLSIRYSTEEGRIEVEEFDLVVLSHGIEASPHATELAGRLDVELNYCNFAKVDPFAPVATSRPGIYAAGIFTGPKDIPSSVVEASAAACAAGMSLNKARGTEIKTMDLPEEMDVSDQEPRIGVFVCNCGINIGSVVDVPAATEYARTLPFVVHAQEELFACAQDSQDRLKDLIKEHNLNRIVMSACSPRTHEPLFQETILETGLNKYLFEMANIRDQNSWVHKDEPDRATEKAKDLIRMGVARASVLRPLAEKKIGIIKKALVIGGGVAGMTSALGLANQGFETVIVEKEAELGGMARNLTATIEGDDIQEYLKGLSAQVEANNLIEVLTESLIVDFSGFQGNFKAEIMVGPTMTARKIEHGVVIVATGAHEYEPTEYHYPDDDRIRTQIEFGQYLAEAEASDVKNVVMIQCVGSRNEDSPNCSRVCCQTAVKNAIHVKELNPKANVIVLNRDIRTYGLMEEYYTEARRLGVTFAHYDPDAPPLVEPTSEGINVTFTDDVLERDVTITADNLVLSAGMRAEDTGDLTSLLKLARDDWGYFMEAHVKLRPLDTAKNGIFVCGTAHSPKLVTETIAQAMGAAARAATFLSQPEITLSAVTARVDQENCAACLVCVRACPFGVPRINEDGVSEIDEALCQGCGICASECPAKAIELDWYEDEQLISKVDALLEGVI
ncbi:MAG: FAD-dependent oxidoreductase [Candidatus Adiutricales bacterium]